MKALSFKEPWVRSYVERLLGLSATTKRSIIRVLERSMDQRCPNHKKGLSDRFGVPMVLGTTLVPHKNWHKPFGRHAMTVEGRWI